VTTGDNFYQNGVASINDTHWTQSFTNIYNSTELQKLKWFTCLGNHDYQGQPQAQIDYSKTNPRWVMPARYYHKRLRRGGVSADLLVIDTIVYIPAHTNSSSIKSKVISGQARAQRAWLKRKLRNARGDWQIVVGHHAIYSGSRLYEDQIKIMHKKFSRLFRKGGVDLYLSGHDHDLQLLKNPNHPTYQIVSGGGQESRALNQHPFHIFAKASAGFASLRLAKQSFGVKFINEQGQVIGSSLRSR
jgi:tartrate-resistant acid phosphatase type 5